MQEQAPVTTFERARDYVRDHELTGYSLVDQTSLPDVYEEKNRDLCCPVWSSKAKKRLFPITRAINDALPIENDLDMLKGGLVFECMLHESLIQHKKTLAVNHYNEMALRLTTPSSFPFALLHGTPVAFAGVCEETVENTLKTKQLKGPVVMEPVIRFNVNRVHAIYET